MPNFGTSVKPDKFKKEEISLGLGIFWVLRLFIQFFQYASLLWKGKTFETIIHILFAIIRAYLSTVFLIAYFS